MENAKVKISTVIAGLAASLLSGVPAIADDTELLLVSPSNPSLVKPNVMFILDTSGSMNTEQSSGAQFDPNIDYSGFGSCNKDTFYINENGSIPDCSSHTQYIDKSAFQCADANTQMAGVGRYTDVFVQYRPNSSSANEWQEVEDGNHTDFIECESDDGDHGNIDGSNPTHVYPAAGAGTSDPWTDDSNLGISWGSSGKNVTYTVFDGNYINHRNDPATVIFTRSQIMKDVTKNVLNSVNNMNVGFMRFNETQGGPVLMAPVDLDMNRSAIMTTIDGLGANGWTPLSETLYESALFWMGLPAHYGETISEHTTDPVALASSGPEVYAQPTMLSCSKNFNVLITDGMPTEDLDTPGLLGYLPGYGTVLNRTGCTGTATDDGACLDDIAEYLSLVDVNPGLAGQQSVITNTVGYTVDLQILKDTALNSGGEYVLANDIGTLTTALTDIVSQINERSLSFSAPAVSVNTFNRTRNLNNVYMTMFGARGRAHWPGNLKAYRVDDGVIVDATGAAAVDPSTGFFFDTARSFWTIGAADGNDVTLGGAAHNLPAPSARRLFTNNGFDSRLSAPSNLISAATANLYTEADFGFSGGVTPVADIVDWMLGVDVNDVDNDPLTTKRNQMGDPLHSRPASIVYGGTEAAPDTVIYTATNDGYLHAIDASNGRELWSYVPKELLPKMVRYFDDPIMAYKLYGIDGDIVPVVRDNDRDGQIEPLDGDFVIILFGMRRGGSTYRAIDVTDRNNPDLLWERVLDEGGQSWPSPVVARVDIGNVTQNALNATVIIGGGYDSVNDTTTFNPNPDAIGAGVHMLDLFTGQTVWRAGHTSTAADLKSDSFTRSIPTAIRTIDINGDSFADRMYASDMGGQLWRFDITNGNDRDALVAGGVIAQLGGEGMTSAPSPADTRRFYNSPDIAMFNDTRQNRRFISVSIGSGYRAHPLDVSSDNRFYSLRDPNVFNALTQNDYNNHTAVTESDLVDITGKVDTTVTASDAGWMLRLPGNEMVLSDSATFNNEVFFVSFAPDVSGVPTCDVGQGINYLYRVSILNGDPIVADLSQVAPGTEDAERKQTLAQGGIAPSPQFLFPSADASCTGDDCNPPPIGCIGVECFDPGFENNPVRTLWTQDGIE